MLTQYPFAQKLNPVIFFVPSSGMSITNAAECYANQIIQKYDLEPEKCIFIEHYPADSIAEEHFDKQEFTWKDKTATNIKWVQMRKPEQIKMIKLALDSAN